MTARPPLPPPNRKNRRTPKTFSPTTRGVCTCVCVCAAYGMGTFSIDTATSTLTFGKKPLPYILQVAMETQMASCNVCLSQTIFEGACVNRNDRAMCFTALCVCVYVCVCVCMYVCMYMYVCMCVYMYVYVCVCVFKWQSQLLARDAMLATVYVCMKHNEER